MDRPTNILERAFQLAKSGEFSSIETLKLQMKREGYGTLSIYGRCLNRQLRDLIKAHAVAKPSS